MLVKFTKKLELTTLKCIERSEKRLSEVVVLKLAKIMDFFLVGSASKYRSVKAELLAKTMVSRIDSKPGVNYFYFDDLLK